MLTFPIHMTFEEISNLEGAAEAFMWDPSMIDEDDEDSTLVATIENYSTAYHSSEQLAAYLKNVGYEAHSETGVTILNRNALRVACAIFGSIIYEYDSQDLPRVQMTQGTHKWDSTATWALFGLGGDDDVDYCGTQPSCLSDFLYDLTQEG